MRRDAPRRDGRAVGFVLKRAAAVAAVVVAVVAAPAAAEELGRVAEGSELAAGPVFAGEGAVWVERDARGALLLARSDSDNRVAVGVAPPEGLRYEVVDLAATSHRVAVARRVLRLPPPSGASSCGRECPKLPVEEPYAFLTKCGPVRQTGRCAGSCAATRRHGVRRRWLPTRSRSSATRW